MTPLRIRSLGAYVYSAYSAPAGVFTCTPLGGGVWKIPTACWAAVSSAGSLKRDHARASTCSAVPCDRPLVHGGLPPSNGNMYSHAIPPARLVASGSTSPSSWRRLEFSGPERKEPLGPTHVPRPWPC